MRTRILGKTKIEVGVVGFGAMALSLRDRPPEKESHDIMRHVFSSGVNLIDTADTYCLGPDELHHNERLVAKAVAGDSSVLIATKGGTRRTPKGWEIDGEPGFLYRSICASYEALGGQTPIPIWQLHWPDPRYSIEQMFKPVQRAIDEKLVRFVGVCNFARDQLQQAADLVPLISVQNQFNLWHREAESDGVIEYCEQHGLIFLPWRPLGGLGLSHLLYEVQPLANLARERKISPQRLMIAWHLAKSPCIVPIPGSRRLEHFLDCLAGQHEQLHSAEMRKLDALSSSDLPKRERPAAWEGRPPLAN
jgi:aryl-alcohol dehydrogenase-like predicted oxidoreductase